jgi:hypothetical protein
MKKTTTYLDTSVISVYVADKVTADQGETVRRADTQAFWALARKSATLITSQLAEAEAQQGHPRQSRRRAIALRGVRKFAETEESRALAARYAHSLGRSADDHDLRHLAAAAVARAALFVTWDLKSMDANSVAAIAGINLKTGHSSPVAMTPAQALKYLGGHPRSNPARNPYPRAPIPRYIQKIVARIRQVRARMQREERAGGFFYGG